MTTRTYRGLLAENIRLLADVKRLRDFAEYVLEMDPGSDAPLFSKARNVLAATEPKP